MRATVELRDDGRLVSCATQDIAPAANDRGAASAEKLGLPLDKVEAVS